jgi:hypothetical protein
MKGLTVQTQKGTHNYVIDLLEGSRFPFAINQCTATDVLGNKWYKYQCHRNSKKWTVTKTEYSNSNCTTNGTLLTNWQSNSTSDSQSSEQEFECDGMDTYVEFEIGMAGISNCTNGVTVFAALSSCVSSGFDQYEFYCNTSMALLEMFSNSQTVTSTAMPSSTSLSTTTGAATSTTTGAATSTTTNAATSTTTNAVTSTTTDAPAKGATGIGSAAVLNATASSTSTTGNTIVSQVLSTILSTSTSISSTSTSSSTSTQVQATCASNNFCNRLVLPRNKCTTSPFIQAQNDSLSYFVQMKQCKPVIFTVLSSSIRPHLAVTGIISLLLLICLF